MAAVLQGADPWFVDDAVTTDEVRAAGLAPFAPAYSGSTVTPEGGVLIGYQTSPLSVTATVPSASMAVRVLWGQCVIPRANQYGYLCTLPATGTVDISAADATNARIDSVIARVRDSDLGDATNGVWSKGFGIEVVEGTPSGSPVAPDLSAIPSYLLLANVTVPALATTIQNANIADQRVYTRANGGVRYASRALSRPGSSAYDLRVTPDGSFEAWDAGASVWVPIAIVGAWTPYTPTWTGAVSNPSLGNGVMNAAYRKLGRTVDVRINMTMGSTTTYGSGRWIWSLPVPARTVSGHAPWPVWVGQCLTRDVSGFNYFRDVSFIDGSGATTLGAIAPDNQGYNVTNPIAWASGDTLAINITYESAA